MSEIYRTGRVKVSIPRTRSEELGKKDREPLGKGNRLSQVQDKKLVYDISAPPTQQMSHFSLEAQKSLDIQIIPACQLYCSKSKIGLSIKSRLLPIHHKPNCVLWSCMLKP